MADQAQTEIETRDAETVGQAMAALRQLDLAGVERLLRPVLANAPADYINEFEEDGKRYIKFWDLEEFMAHVAWATPTEPASSSGCRTRTRGPISAWPLCVSRDTSGMRRSDGWKQA